MEHSLHWHTLPLKTYFLDFPFTTLNAAFQIPLPESLSPLPNTLCWSSAGFCPSHLFLRVHLLFVYQQLYSYPHKISTWRVLHLNMFTSELSPAMVLSEKMAPHLLYLSCQNLKGIRKSPSLFPPFPSLTILWEMEKEGKEFLCKIFFVRYSFFVNYILCLLNLLPLCFNSAVTILIHSKPPLHVTWTTPKALWLVSWPPLYHPLIHSLHFSQSDLLRTWIGSLLLKTIQWLPLDFGVMSETFNMILKAHPKSKSRLGL